MDSNRLLVGLLGGVERRFELCGRDVVAVAVAPLLVEPGHPRQRRELEVLDVIPSCSVGTVDAFGLVEAIGRLGEGVVDRLSATVPMLGRAPISSRRSVKRTEVNWDPASEWVTSPTRRCAPREDLAISRASRTMSVRMWDATRQPTIIRLNASTIKQT